MPFDVRISTPDRADVKYGFTTVMYHFTHVPVIKSFKHKGLKELFESGSSRRIEAALHKRARVRLFALSAATGLHQLAQPGFDFHKLRGKPERYTIHVNGPWCITFRWENGHATEVDLQQYH